jgi:hypothetical protein
VFLTSAKAEPKICNSIQTIYRPAYAAAKGPFTDSPLSTARGKQKTAPPATFRRSVTPPLALESGVQFSEKSEPPEFFASANEAQFMIC